MRPDQRLDPMQTVDESQLTWPRKIVLGVQFLFVAFGSTVLVPILVSQGVGEEVMTPALALFTAGVGTLLFHLVTQGKVPIFLGSSFAFIAPIILSTSLYGFSGTISGIMGVSLVYFIMSALIRWRGVGIIHKLFPPIVIGPVIMLIGLSLSGSAISMAQENWIVAIIALAASVLVMIKGKGMLRLIPIFIGIGVGYIAALCFGLVDFEPVLAAPVFALPEFCGFHFCWEAMLFMIPVAIAPVVEHIGDVYVVNSVTGKDFTEDHGLHRTMFGDGLACLFASLIGGPPVTTYSEVTGAMTITGVKSPQVIRIAAVTAILFSLVGVISAFLSSIPSCVLGGIMMLLFGTIACTGVSNMIDNKVDMTETRNIIIFAVTMTLGIGGAAITVGTLTLSGIGLSAIAAVILNLILPKTKKQDGEPAEAVAQ